MINVATLKDEYSKKSVQLRKKVKSDDSRKVDLKPFIILPSFLLTPTMALAAETGAETTFANIYGAVMRMFDGATVLIIIFAGASWMLGHRSRAIEMLIGACCGYLLARHAIDIRNLLKTI